MFVNPGKIRPWEWLDLLNYLNEPVLAMALVVKHRHTGTCTGTNHLPSPRSSRKASQENSCQNYRQNLPALTDSLLRGRKRWRQSCVLPNASGITVSVSEGNSELRLLYIAFLYRLYQNIPHKLQTSPIMQLQGHMCQGVTLWYNHLSSSFVSFYCAVTQELVSHFWAMTFFPFILWSWNINHNNILIFGSSCFYNTYLYFPSYYVFEIELSSQCWCPTWYVTEDDIAFLILLSSSSECWGYGVPLCLVSWGTGD